jgi:hypothetical protein
MYLGRERLGPKKIPLPPIRQMGYTDADLAAIEGIVDRIKVDYPEFTDLQARVWEVISRYRGEAGLSADKVSYLASAICAVVSQVQVDKINEALRMLEAGDNG